MKMDELIAGLASDVPPVRAQAVGHRLTIGIAAGSLVSLALVLTMLGTRPDLEAALATSAFWMKWSYTLSLAAIAAIATVHLARPDARHLRSLRLVGIPVALLAVTGALELARTPPADWLAMWLGHSWRQCPWRILALAVPIFIGLLWSFRRLAPTRLRAAGGVAGLAAGAFGATVYGLHCPEVSAIFVLTWYSLGMALASLVGALLGPRLLRW